MRLFPKLEYYDGKKADGRINFFHENHQTWTVLSLRSYVRLAVKKGAL